MAMFIVIKAGGTVTWAYTDDEPRVVRSKIPTVQRI